MKDSVIKNYENIHQMNLQLLSFSRNGEWAELIALAERYVVAVNNALALSVNGEPVDIRDRLRELLSTIVTNEAEIQSLLAQRLDDLRSTMSTLNKGKKKTLAYSGSFTSVN